MIDLTQLMPCECGQPDCDYDETAPMGDAQAVAEALVLDSALLRLEKERNEARALVDRILKADAAKNDTLRDDALLEAFRARRSWGNHK